MRSIALSSVVTLLAFTGCVKEPSAPVLAETFALRATITSDNHCTVEARGRTYSSIGQVRGAVLPSMSGTVENAGWHAIGCWVQNADGSDGELAVVFAGDSFQKPFATGVFMPRFDPPYGSDEKFASVSFRASYLPNEKLKTVNESEGAVTVESSPNGERTIRIDVTAARYQY